jgi:hypothetical protein
MSRSRRLTLTPSSISQARADGIEDLLALHWAEVETDQAKNPLAINWAGYRDLEARGVFKPLLLYREGRLIGYTCWFIQPPLHHSLTCWAVCDLLYVPPEERLGMTGVYLIVESERQVRALGARTININVKAARFDTPHPPPTLGPLLARLGYRLTEEAWCKLS